MSDFQPKGHLAMLGANTIWGLMSPVTKLVLTTSAMTPLLMIDCRIFIACALFWFTSIFCPKEHVPPRDLFRLCGAAALGILFNQCCFIFGVSLTSPGEASLITTTMPMWVMVLAYIVLREPISAKKIGGIALGAIGAVTLMLSSKSMGDQADNPALGDAIVLLAQLSYALYLTFYKNFIHRYSLVTLMKWMFLFASIALLPASLPSILSMPWQSLTLMQWAGIGYVAVSATFIAYIFIMIGQKNLRPTIVGIYNYVQPMVATIVGVCLGLDSLTAVKVVAILLVFSGVYLVTISPSRASLRRHKRS